MTVTSGVDRRYPLTMLRQGRIGVGLIVVALAMVGFSSTAQADFVASGSDPAGDATDPDPSRDITGAGMSYDRRQGALAGFIRFRRYPGDAPSFITLFAGIRTPTGCDGLPAGGFGTFSEEFEAGWYRLGSPGGSVVAKGDADKTGIDSVIQEFEVSSKELAGHRWNCVVATVTEQGNPQNVYDTTGAVPLKGLPSLSLNVKGPKRFKRNRRQILRFRLSNPGDGAARRVRLRFGHARGMRLSKYRKSLGTIRPGTQRKFRIRVRFSKRARPLTTVKLRGSSGKLRLKGKLKLRVHTRPKPGKPSGGGGGGDGSGQASGVCVKYAPDLSGETGGSLILVPCLR